MYMTGKMKIEFLNQGFIDVLSCAGTYDMIDSQAQDIAKKAGEGFGKDVVKGYSNTRWIAFVHAETAEAAKAEAEDKVLSRAVL